jgi:hypothetical protein
MSERTPPLPILDALPGPGAIRERLSELASEADLLRGLLRLLEKRECGRYFLRKRRAAGRKEAARA